MNIFLLTLSRLYAKAIFDFAFENSSLDKWELMLIAAKKITQYKIIQKLLCGINYIDHFELSEIFIAFGEHVFDCYFQNFIRIMAEYKRLYLIPFILNQFLFFRRNQEIVIKMKIITVDLLSDSELSKIVSFMQEKLSCKIDVSCKFDRSILGGIIICINNVVIDGSVRGRIQRLKDLLIT